MAPDLDEERALGKKDRTNVDQLSAHLDRGWDLAQKGDASGASACARRALELDPQSPEVHNLLGYAAALAGEPEEAIEHYRQAIALDDTYFEAMLNAAEVLMYPLGEWDEAVALCDDALLLAETSEETLDSILLKVDALLGKGDQQGAKKAMAQIPAGPFKGKSYSFLIGRAFYEVGEIEKASPLIEEAVREEPAHADAHYYLGLIRDDRGDGRGAVEAFLKSRSLDLAKAPAPWSPTPEAFATIVQDVLSKTDTLLARHVQQAEVYIVDVPGAELVVDGMDPRALLILEAPHHHHGNNNGGAAAIGRLFVYQRNVERAAGSLDGLEDELTRALEREIQAVFAETEREVPLDKSKLN